jgi:hypothetical protein
MKVRDIKECKTLNTNFTGRKPKPSEQVVKPNKKVISSSILYSLGYLHHFDDNDNKTLKIIMNEDLWTMLNIVNSCKAYFEVSTTDHNFPACFQKPTQVVKSSGPFMITCLVHSWIPLDHSWFTWTSSFSQQMGFPISDLSKVVDRRKMCARVFLDSSL